MAVVNILLDKRRIVGDLGIIRVSVYHGSIQRLFSTNIKCTQDHYDKLKLHGSKLDELVC
jgi:hypothetical protein